MSPSIARIDDPTQDTPSDNIDAVQVQQEIQRLATAGRPRTSGVDNTHDHEYEHEEDVDEDEDDEYLAQYELDSEEEDAYLSQVGVEDLNIEDEDWEVADGDFTKLYNRMRQHQKVLSTLPVTRNGTQGIKGEADTEADMPLPVRNARSQAGGGGGQQESGEMEGRGLTPRQRRAVERRLMRQREEAGEEAPGEAGPSSSLMNGASTTTPSTSNKKKPTHPTGIPSNPGLLGGVPSAPKHFSLSANQKDKADRATVEQVLDSRTRAVLVSLIRRGLVGGVQGCVSTGKEANVYFAPGPTSPPEEIGEGKSYPKPYPRDLALKIYKTSILSFKSRSQYIQGEHRFRNAYTKVANPRKMVKVWAEKELRNLRRLYDGGVRCPRVVDVRENVLVMEFLGSAPSLEEQGGQVLIQAPIKDQDQDQDQDDGADEDDTMPKNVRGQAGDQDEAESSRASKRLKDADVDLEELRELYAELLGAMRWMFRRCRLVHTDLSEYNILYHDAHLYIIDVSQSVEHDHPSAFDFLRHDIKNVDEFFKRRSGGDIRTLGIRGTFDFVTGDKLDRFDDDGNKQGSIGEDEETEDVLKEVVREWLESGVGLKDDKLDLSTSEGLTPAQDEAQHSAGRRETDEAVFMSSYIPRNLGEVYDPERDIDVIAAGKGDDLIYAGLTGVSGTNGNASSGMTRPKSSLKHTGESTNEEGKKGGVKWEDEQDDEDSEDEDEDDEADDDKEKRPRGFRHEDKDSKKERKKALKEEKREKRQTKMPKAEKARRIKQTAHSK